LVPFLGRAVPQQVDLQSVEVFIPNAVDELLVAQVREQLMGMATTVPGLVIAMLKVAYESEIRKVDATPVVAGRVAR